MCVCVCVTVTVCVCVCASTCIHVCAHYIYMYIVPSKENLSLCITLVAGGIVGFFNAVDGARCELDERGFLVLALADPGGD